MRRAKVNSKEEENNRNTHQQQPQQAKCVSHFKTQRTCVARSRHYVDAAPSSRSPNAQRSAVAVQCIVVVVDDVIVAVDVAVGRAVRIVEWHVAAAASVVLVRSRAKRITPAKGDV